MIFLGRLCVSGIVESRRLIINAAFLIPDSFDPLQLELISDCWWFLLDHIVLRRITLMLWLGIFVIDDLRILIDLLV